MTLPAPMSHSLRSVRRVLVTSMLLLGYLSTVAEEAIPDDHDWHRTSAGIIAAEPSDAPAPTGPGVPTHGVHVCHDGHQHTSTPSAGTTGQAQARASDSAFELSIAQPRIPPLQPFFRPPIA